MRALVTGASRGLGRTVAELLARDGWSLLLTAREEAPLHDAAAALRDAGAAAVEARAGDVTDPDHRLALAAAVGDRLDLLVNNASTLGPSPRPHLREAPEAAWRSVFETNVIAPLALTRALLPALGAARGRVAMITSDAARGGYPGWGVYGASKAALELAARTLAAEEAEVALSTVDPGDLRTRMHQRAFPHEDIGDRPTPAVTTPFWHWWLARPATEIDGRHFQAQGAAWTVAPQT